MFLKEIKINFLIKRKIIKITIASRKEYNHNKYIFVLNNSFLSNKHAI